MTQAEIRQEGNGWSRITALPAFVVPVAASARHPRMRSEVGMVESRGQPIVVAVGLVVGYALGLAGWVWDDLEHIGWLQLGDAAAHRLMILGIVLVLGALALAVARAAGRLPAYGCLAVGLALLFVHPVAGPIALLSLPAGAAWVQAQSGRRSLWPIVAAAGIALVLAGMAVDWLWHNAYPHAQERNMLLLPGHQIELAGWLVGFLGASVALWHPHAGDKGYSGSEDVEGATYTASVQEGGEGSRGASGRQD